MDAFLQRLPTEKVTPDCYTPLTQYYYIYDLIN